MEALLDLLKKGQDTDEKQNLGYYYPDANKYFRLLHCYEEVIYGT